MSCHSLSFSSQHAPVLNGGVAMDSVSHPTDVVMDTGTALMAVMNSSVVSTELLMQWIVSYEIH